LIQLLLVGTAVETRATGIEKGANQADSEKVVGCIDLG
jgi:hypothetical protein